MKQFYRKYIYLPTWWLLLGRPVPFKYFDNYDRGLSQITNGLLNDKDVILTLNSRKYRIYLNENNKPKIEPYEDLEVK